MRIFGKDINDECQYCGRILECELFRHGHGINEKRKRVSEMVSCQLKHMEERENEDKR